MIIGPDGKSYHFEGTYLGALREKEKYGESTVHVIDNGFMDRGTGEQRPWKNYWFSSCVC